MKMLTTLVRYFCPCGYSASARSAYAALAAIADHHQYCHVTDPRD